MALELISLDPAINRYRCYRLHAERSMLGELELVIEWGRAGTFLRSRVERFTSERDLNRRFWELLERRRRHGYVPAVEGFRVVQGPSDQAG